jgi:purine/pyrimidine-nucleoside phosphorylase
MAVIVKIGAFALLQVSSQAHCNLVHNMTTSSIPHVTLTTAANVYFDGKCVSHSFTLADGTKKSVGVVLPSQLTFGTGAAEIMECVAGACEYKLAGSDVWVTSKAGEQFHVPANSKFDIKVAEAYHYICHYA